MSNAEKLHDGSPMPIGKYRGTAMEDVPADYLLYFYREGKITRPELLEYVEDNLQVLELEEQNMKNQKR